MNDIVEVNGHKFEILNVNNRNRNFTEKATKTRVYISVNNESILDNLVNRTLRPYKLWKKVVEYVLNKNKVRFNKLSWSQTCGCQCGCSPGFITDNVDRVDWYIDISEV